MHNSNKFPIVSTWNEKGGKAYIVLLITNIVHMFKSKIFQKFTYYANKVFYYAADIDIFFF